jgi:hypothetical protein
MSRPRPTDLSPTLTPAEASSLAPPERARIIALCSLAFDEDFRAARRRSTWTPC